MTSLLNSGRPPVFCPGCSHERVTRALDAAFQKMGIAGHQAVIVSDIGCSGLFDTFFNTHAFHGLHGRALTYAAGLKMARPDLRVIVTLGDGGLGIGGAHLLAACRRNLDMTLLILNNFNFGMTGGQFSATTPSDARVASGFLNRIERPFDACRVAAAAGAPYADRVSSYAADLPERLQSAILYPGFAVVDIWGACTGRYTAKNRLTPKGVDDALAALPPSDGPVPENERPEYGEAYRRMSATAAPPKPPAVVEAVFPLPSSGRQDVVILGGAGQRILTAGEILCLSAMTAGMKATQKNDYNITVLRGPSISEVILSPEPVGFTGIERPHILLALGQEGVDRRRDLFAAIDASGWILQAEGVTLPPSAATVRRVNFRDHKVKPQDMAVAALAVMAGQNRGITPDMLKAGLAYRFAPPVLDEVRSLVENARRIA